MEWTKYPFVRFLLFFSAGIVLSFYKDFTIIYLIVFSLLFLVLFLTLHFFTPLKFKSQVKTTKSILACLLVTTAGSLTFTVNHPAFSGDHFSKKNYSEYRAVVSERVKSREGFSQATLTVKYVRTKNGWEKSEGKILVFYKRSELGLKYGSDIIIEGKPQQPEKPKNPYQFDYSHYLFSKGITHTQFLSSKNTLLLTYSPISRIKELSVFSAEKIKNILTSSLTNENAEALLLGLLLGDKTMMTDEVRSNFSSSGLVHILAVSGFHTTLIYQILTLLLGKLKRNPKGEILFACTAIVILWFYALTTGLSASAVRATVMLSLLLIAKLLRKEVNGVHILCLAAFLILLFDPLALFDLGLQLSFLAVLGIILFTHRISSLGNFKTLIFKKSWELTSVALAAQIFTFPLAIYVFHKFPLYFIGSNLLAIVPVVTLIYSGIFLLLSYWVPFVKTFLVFVIEKTAILLESIVELISTLPTFTDEIYFSNFQLLTLIAGFFLFLYSLLKKELKHLKYSYLFLILFSVSLITEQVTASHQKLLAVFHIKNQTFVAAISGLKATVYSTIDSPAKSKQFNYIVSEFLKSKNIHYISFEKIKFPTLLTFQSKKIVFSKGNNEISLNKEVDYIIFNGLHSSVISRKKLKGKVEIFDGSNENNIPYKGYKTCEKGAFIEEL